jgi:hypothetical protein
MTRACLTCTPVSLDDYSIFIADHVTRRRVTDSRPLEKSVPVVTLGLGCIGIGDVSIALTRSSNTAPSPRGASYGRSKSNDDRAGQRDGGASSSLDVEPARSASLWDLASGAMPTRPAAAASGAMLTATLPLPRRRWMDARWWTAFTGLGGAKAITSFRSRRSMGRARGGTLARAAEKFRGPPFAAGFAALRLAEAARGLLERSDLIDDPFELPELFEPRLRDQERLRLLRLRRPADLRERAPVRPALIASSRCSMDTCSSKSAETSASCCSNLDNTTTAFRFSCSGRNRCRSAKPSRSSSLVSSSGRAAASSSRNWAKVRGACSFGSCATAASGSTLLINSFASGAGIRSAVLVKTLKSVDVRDSLAPGIMSSVLVSASGKGWTVVRRRARCAGSSVGRPTRVAHIVVTAYPGKRLT